MKTSARGIDGEEAVTERRYRKASRFRAGSEIMGRDEGSRTSSRAETSREPCVDLN